MSWQTMGIFFSFFRNGFLLTLIAFSLSWSCSDLWAKKLTIDVREGIFDPVPLAFPTMEGGETFSEMSKVITADLTNSGAFRITQTNGPQTARESYDAPALWDWRLNSGSYLLSAVPYEGGAGFGIAFRLYDLDTQKMLLNEVVDGSSEEWRRIAHSVADLIYQRITGEAGYFNTKILYTAQYGKPTKPTMRIAIMDQDGANSRFLTSEDYMAITPRFSFTDNKISYIGYRRNRIVNHILDLGTGEHETFKTPGVCFSNRFHPKEPKIIFCSAKGDSTTIYAYNLRTRRLENIAQTSGSIDVSPSFSPDGNRMVFSSDRGGSKPKLYVMAAHGGPASLLSAGAGSYYMPTWSPNGKFIAFVKRQGDTYYLGVMNADGSGERLIASDHVIDCPSWAPNSRLIAFSAQQRYFGPFHVFVVNLSGHCLRKIPTEHGANHPNWSTCAKQ